MEILVEVNILKAIAIILGVVGGFSIMSTLLLIFHIFYDRHPQEKCYVLENKVPHSAVTPEGKFKAFSPTEPEFGGTRE